MRLAILTAPLALAAVACSAPPDTRHAAQLAARDRLEATADRADLELTRVELSVEKRQPHMWGVTYVNGETITMCLDCGESYAVPQRAIGGER